MARIWVEAYGCSASFADSEMISGMLVNGGHALAQNPDESDLNLIVTCSVKDATANKMIHRIRSLGDRPLVVAGCLAKAEKETVARLASGASMMGPTSISKTIDVVNATLQGRQVTELSDSDISKVGLPKVRLNPAVGIVEIASGCKSDCTFCQTKIAKGDLSSYRVGDIARQVEAEIGDGCKEIWLTSTDNGCYGLDIGSSLPELVDAVADIKGDFMVRVGMMNPMYMPRIKDDLIESYSSPKVFRFIHVPVQSGSDRVLNDMRRGHTADTFADIVAGLRRRFGVFTISTDIIVGYPTETEEDFEETVRLLRECRPDIVNLSRYSARPGTEAATLEQIDVGEVKRRSKILADLICDISRQSNRRWIGWRGQVLFDEHVDGQTRGRNFAYKPIYVDGPVAIGQRRTVEITDSSDHSLIGQIAS